MPPPPKAPTCMDTKICLSNILDREVVFQRLLIVEGTAGHGNGSLKVQHDLFAPQSWEVNGSYFKALVPLSVGQNELTFIYESENGSQRASTVLSITYVRPSSLPLHLAIVAASDSPVWHSEDQASSSSTVFKSGHAVSRVLSKVLGRLNTDSSRERRTDKGGQNRALVDAPPGSRRDLLHAEGLNEIKKRIALQAYLWQAFHAEQMRRFGMGRRTFQLDDSDLTDGADKGVRELSSMPRIHLLRSRHTMKEFRDPENAQQNHRAQNGGAMHAFAREALEDPSTPRCLHSSPVAVLTLDTMWDPEMKLLRAHGAIGGGGPGQISLGVMGSHWIWAAPSSLDRVTYAFLDTAATHESCVNDLNECPTAWQTLNIGSGAFFHEVGHAFNNPHWPSGVMSRGYVEFNRAFVTREPGCPRNGVKRGDFLAPIHAGNDDQHFHLHRAQAVRARWHPSCRLPGDPPLPHLNFSNQASWAQWNENEPTWTSTPDGALLTSASGIGVVEIDFDGEHRARYEWLNLTDDTHAETPPTQFVVTPARLSALVGFDVMSPLSPSIKLNALACNMHQAELEDFRMHGVARPLTIPGINSSRLIIRSMPLGSPSSGNRKWDLIFPHERDGLLHSRPVLRSITIYSGACFDGLQFVYSDGYRSVFGPCGGSPYALDLDAEDSIARIKVRAGAWIDAIEIVLTSGRTSGMRGNSTGGSLRTLEPLMVGAANGLAAAPQGKIVGLFGSSGAWMDSLGAYTTSS